MKTRLVYENNQMKVELTAENDAEMQILGAAFSNPNSENSHYRTPSNPEKIDFTCTVTAEGHLSNHKLKSVSISTVNPRTYRED